MSNKITQPTQPTQSVSPQENTVCQEKKETYSASIELAPYQQTAPCKDDQQKILVTKTEEERKQRYDRLRFSALGKIKFLIECPEYKQGTISFYLLYRLITAETQDEIMKLFSNSPYYPMDSLMDKLPNRPEFHYLKNDGIALIKERVYSVDLFHKVWNPDHLKHSGFLFFSISKDDFENKEAFRGAKEKIKLLPNIMLAYISTYERFYEPHSNIVFAVYCGELPNVSGLPRDSIDYYPLRGYDERWMQYMKLIKRVLGIKKNYTNPELGLVLATDPEAWFNSDTSQFLNWQKLVTEYELVNKP